MNSFIRRVNKVRDYLYDNSYNVRVKDVWLLKFYP